MGRAARAWVERRIERARKLAIKVRDWLADKVARGRAWLMDKVARARELGEKARTWLAERIARAKEMGEKGKAWLIPWRSVTIG